MNPPNPKPALTPPKVEWNLPMTVAAVLASPLGIVSAGFGWATEALERHVGVRRLNGEDAADHTADVVNGEVIAIVGMLASGLTGVFIAKALDPAPSASSWWSFVWMVMLVGLGIAVVRFFRWTRHEVQAAKTGAWEPEVAPDVAIKSLQELWAIETVRARKSTTRVVQG